MGDVLHGRPVPDCLVREHVVDDDVSARQRRKLKNLRQIAAHVGVDSTSTTGAPPNPYPLDHDHSRRMPAPARQGEAIRPFTMQTYVQRSPDLYRDSAAGSTIADLVLGRTATPPAQAARTTDRLEGGTPGRIAGQGQRPTW